MNRTLYMVIALTRSMRVESDYEPWMILKGIP